MIRIAVAGIQGRMGQSVLAAAARFSDLEIVCGLVPRKSSDVGTHLDHGTRRIPLTDQLTVECDVLLDVSTTEGTAAWLAHCERHDIPMVIGVTGHSQAQLKRIKEAAHLIPIVFASNFSVGLNAVLEILAPLANTLGEGFDVEIVETHHRNKVDAPSGTALAIVDQLRHVQKVGSEDLSVIGGRQGTVGPRPAGEIAIHAVRMGDVVGQHEIHFSGFGETVTIRHTAHSREAFASGALRAAMWLVGKGAGFYSMSDVLAVESTPEPGVREADPGF